MVVLGGLNFRMSEVPMYPYGLGPGHVRVARVGVWALPEPYYPDIWNHTHMKPPLGSSLAFPLLLNCIERCSPRQQSRMKRLRAKVEPLLTSVIVDYPDVASSTRGSCEEVT